MTRFASVRQTGLALVVAVLGLAGPAAAGDTVPLSGFFLGDVVRTPIPGTSQVAVDIDGAGLASPLGLFSVEFPHVVTFPARTAEGTMTFTTLFGEKLKAEMTGLSTPIEGTTYLFIEEQGTVTGGTGRFAGATGSFTVARLFDTVSLQTIGFIDGTVSKPRR